MSGNLVKHAVRTIYGSNLQTLRQLGKDIDIYEHSTINEVLSDPLSVRFQPSNQNLGLQECDAYNPSEDSDRLKMGYVVIGNGGHTNSVTANDVGYMGLNIHSPTDAALFNMLPFICRPIDMDLDDEQRRDYRLRKVLQIDGEFYVAYYAKVLDFSNSDVNMVISTTVNGETTSLPFRPNVNNLRPKPIQAGVENDGSKVHATANVPLKFTTQDVAYLNEACMNLYGSTADAIISEIGICSGADKPIVRSYSTAGGTSDSSIANRDLYESVGVQVCCFVNTYYQANLGYQGMSIIFDVGAIEPLFGAN